MLSWDDFNSEETQKTPIAEPAKVQAAMQENAVAKDDAEAPTSNAPISTGSILSLIHISEPTRPY